MEEMMKRFLEETMMEAGHPTPMEQGLEAPPDNFPGRCLACSFLFHCLLLKFVLNHYTLVVKS